MYIVGAQNKGEKYGEGKELGGAPGGIWEGGILHFLSPMESGLKALERRTRKFHPTQVWWQRL